MGIFAHFRATFISGAHISFAKILPLRIALLAHEPARRVRRRYSRLLDACFLSPLRLLRQVLLYQLMTRRCHISASLRCHIIIYALFASPPATFSGTHGRLEISAAAERRLFTYKPSRDDVCFEDRGRDIIRFFTFRLLHTLMGQLFIDRKCHLY